MVKTAAILFGLVFLVIGILGFVPACTPVVDGMPMLLAYFHVNTAHNIVHLASGAIFLLCGMASASASRAFFKIFGVVYALVAVLGFYNGDQPLLGLISSSQHNTWLHVGLALLMLLIGFGSGGRNSASS